MHEILFSSFASRRQTNRNCVRKLKRTQAM